MLRTKPQYLHFPWSKLHCDSGAGKQRRAGSTRWLYGFLTLLLGAAKCLVLVVLKEMTLCWQHPTRGETLELCAFQSALTLDVSFIICTQGKLLYRVLRGLVNRESRGGGSARVWSHIPHRSKDTLHGIAMASPTENVPLGWLCSLLRKERPELTPAHLLPSLQAACSCPQGYRAEAAGRRQPGDLCSPLSPGISALS